ncbi:MAG: FHA domain-containing protein [Gammaproteobacteria bacterium]|nr:FHA domain-containing protein [Gammaproteobacteria bacterium]
MNEHAVLVNSNTLEVYAVPDGIVELGRRESMGVCILDPSISGTHARIYNVDEGFWVEDLGSTNGTYIRGATLVEPTMLNEGDVVFFGTLGFTYETRQDFRVEMTSRVDDVEKALEAEDKEVPEHSVPSDSAVKIYRRKTSRVSFDKFKKVIEEGDDFSDSKPLPSKYEVTDSGRILPAKVKRDRQQDFKYKKSQPTPVPWQGMLVAAVLVSLGIGIIIGFVAAQLMG